MSEKSLSSIVDFSRRSEHISCPVAKDRGDGFSCSLGVRHKLAYVQDEHYVASSAVPTNRRIYLGQRKISDLA